MRTYARICDGKVVELFSTDGDIATMFHPSLTWVDITDEIVQPEEGWSYDGDAFTPPDEMEASE
ncbi:hypothetical protein [Cupriavidus necator]